MANIEKLLLLAFQNKASDLHLRKGMEPLIRVNGTLLPLQGTDEMHTDSDESFLEILSDQQRAVFAETNDLDFAYEIEGIARFRANYLKQKDGLGAVFRILPGKIPSYLELGIPTVIEELTKLEKGLILVTGPTGCGKSTTLAAMIDLINEKFSKHIITIEDPIEFVHPRKNCLITHREIGAHTKSFATALRASLREDPDIILIGELRDLETIALALMASETGHLVFGTLHTTSAASTIDRIIDVFPANQQNQIRTVLADVLRGVISQQLIRSADGKSRLLGAEILRWTSALANLIRESKTYMIPSLIQTGKKEGMQTMDQSLLDLVKQKLITFQEAYQKAVDKERFARYLS